jgi:hypothetical protein
MIEPSFQHIPVEKFRMEGKPVTTPDGSGDPGAPVELKRQPKY